MSNRKMNLDRPALNSEQIKARQNFDEVLSKHYLVKAPVWKNPWFWGPTGLASIGIALFLSVSYINSQNNNTHDKTNTLAAKALPKDTECIHPPVAGENVPFQQYAVSASKDEKIVLPSGTEIEIPAGSLQAGDPNAKVQIEVREFPDKVSAFVAGIPMDLGKDQAFESAGMIEIRGTQGGEEVAISPGKPIEVELALTKNPAGFDFWSLNESRKDWEKHPAKYETEKQSAEKPKASDRTEIQKEIAKLDQQMVACEQQKDNVKKPDAAEYKIPQENHQRFDLDFNKKTYPELAKFENLVFEIIPTSGYDKNFTKKTWSEVKLEKAKENYEMIFIAPNDKMKVAVRPVLQGKELKAAQNDFDAAMEDYKETIEEIEAQKTRHEKEKAAYMQRLQSELSGAPGTSLVPANNYTASFSVTNFGVYNCDKPNRYPQAMSEPMFAWGNTTSAAEFKSICVFNLDKDMRFSYGEGSRHSLQEFGIHPNDKVVVFGIDRSGDFGFCELKSGKRSETPGKMVFSKPDDDASLKEMLNKLMHEAVVV